MTGEIREPSGEATGDVTINGPIVKLLSYVFVYAQRSVLISTLSRKASFVVVKSGTHDWSKIENKWLWMLIVNGLSISTALSPRLREHHRRADGKDVSKSQRQVGELWNAVFSDGMADAHIFWPHLWMLIKTQTKASQSNFQHEGGRDSWEPSSVEELEAVDSCWGKRVIIFFIDKNTYGGPIWNQCWDIISSNNNGNDYKEKNMKSRGRQVGWWIPGELWER